MNRYRYTLQKAWQFRRALSKVKSGSAKCVLDINLKVLLESGAKYLVLDYDGVLAAHGETVLSKDVEAWLRSAVRVYGAKNIFILSNKPMQIRKDYFETKYVGMRFIAGVRKKPYPDGLQKIIALTKGKPSEHVLIDDRFLTGMLATVLAGTKGILITNPYQNFSKHFLPELGFALLRFAEKIFF